MISNGERQSDRHVALKPFLNDAARKCLGDGIRRHETETLQCRRRHGMGSKRTREVIERTSVRGIFD